MNLGFFLTLFCFSYNICYCFSCLSLSKGLQSSSTSSDIKSTAYCFVVSAGYKLCCSQSSNPVTRTDTSFSLFPSVILISVCLAANLDSISAIWFRSYWTTVAHHRTGSLSRTVASYTILLTASEGPGHTPLYTFCGASCRLRMSLFWPYHPNTFNHVFARLSYHALYLRWVLRSQRRRLGLSTINWIIDGTAPKTLKSPSNKLDHL